MQYKLTVSQADCQDRDIVQICIAISLHLNRMSSGSDHEGCYDTGKGVN